MVPPSRLSPVDNFVHHFSKPLGVAKDWNTRSGEAFTVNS
jgi:hypothetical protein